jgi:hypothetical protein
VGSLVLSAWMFTAPTAAFGNTNSDLTYTRAQVFSGALRYLRVDLGYEVTEQDPDSAYLMFKFQPPGQRDATHGAFEIVQTSAGVRLWVKLPKLPEYHAVVLRDGLLKKLHEDYGDAPARDPEAKPSEPSNKKKHSSGSSSADERPSPDEPADDDSANEESGRKGKRSERDAQR